MKPWIILLKIVISISILTFLAIRAAKENQFASLVDARQSWTWLFAGLVACLAAQLIATYRWYLLSRALDLPLTFYDALRIGLIGVFFGIVAFGVVGTDALRGFYVASQSPGRRTEAVATVFVDRVIGLLTMFLAAFLGLFAGALASSPGEESAAGLAAIRFVCWFAGAAFAVGVAGSITALVAPQWERFAWFQRCESLPFVGPLLHRMVRLMAYFGRRLPTLGAAFILSALVNVCFIVAIYSVACFVSDQHPTLGDHVTIAPISMVANAVPLPGGIGGMEAALDLLYQAFTANRLQPQMGVPVAFLFRFLLLSIALLGAVAWFTLPARQRAELRQVGEENAPPPQT